MAVVPLTIISSDPLAKFLPPLSATLCSAGLKFLVPEGGMIPPGDTTMVPLNCKLRLLPSHCGLLMSLNQQTKKGVTVLAGVIDPDYQGEIGLLLHSEGKEECVWDTGDPLGHLLVLPCLVIKVNGKIQRPDPGRTTNSPDPSGMKAWVTPPGKEP
ncbi:deoxyuridine 5'-triphosphate nucleotidohydrolase-like [Mesoplodon densirostris]|uniref:deoxyuridine 5'-triphosphate nucleotidohydrolase-like n=1 Tax=Mesoplodon densirostris TaxID=48708 RepID=UPI0028DC9CEB|nr:deoxyuridine 5'-triphosphate nucleotidohydrolase-like [Mesoplodon densirostris]